MTTNRHLGVRVPIFHASHRPLKEVLPFGNMYPFRYTHCFYTCFYAQALDKAEGQAWAKQVEAHGA